MVDLGEQSALLGKYRLLAELGRGGMATVYLALVSGPVGFHKLVVIKQIGGEFAEEPEFLTMFLDEARLAARLNHPNVVQTNEVGQDGLRHFICMEYLEGQPLTAVTRRLVRQKPVLSLGMQLRIAVDALAGLHYAHELADFDGTPLGVVHRDVSPHNIFVTYTGQVKVVDFGIAKAMSSASATRPGVLKGKVAYMSPEQARGDAVDRRADIFAMGVILWEMATGKRLFHGLPEIQIVQAVLQADIPRPAW
jgi:serine/threonine-protein kinase